MKLTIHGSGEDTDYDKIVEYTLIAETETHKSTFEHGFWKNSSGELLLKVNLVDSAGRITFRIEINDIQNNQISKFEGNVETQSLQDLAAKIINSDFSVKTTLYWSC